MKFFVGFVFIYSKALNLLRIVEISEGAQKMIIDTNWHDLTGCPGYLLAWRQFNNNLSQNFVASVQSQA